MHRDIHSKYKSFTIWHNRVSPRGGYNITDRDGQIVALADRDRLRTLADAREWINDEIEAVL